MSKLDNVITNMEGNAIEDVNLCGQGIGEKGAKRLAKVLKKNTSVRKLNLGGNNIGQEGAQHLASALKGNNTLEALYLGANKIGDKGAQHLASALKGNNTLEVLDLNWNDIKDEGAKALAEALKKNTTLEGLGLWMNAISDTGAKALADALKTNKRNGKISDAGAKHFLEALETNKTLTELDLDDTKVSEDMISKIWEKCNKNKKSLREQGDGARQKEKEEDEKNTADNTANETESKEEAETAASSAALNDAAERANKEAEETKAALEKQKEEFEKLQEKVRELEKENAEQKTTCERLEKEKAEQKAAYERLETENKKAADDAAKEINDLTVHVGEIEAEKAKIEEECRVAKGRLKQHLFVQSLYVTKVSNDDEQRVFYVICDDDKNLLTLRELKEKMTDECYKQLIVDGNKPELYVHATDSAVDLTKDNDPVPGNLTLWVRPRSRLAQSAEFEKREILKSIVRDYNDARLERMEQLFGQYKLFERKEGKSLVKDYELREVWLTRAEWEELVENVWTQERVTFKFG